MTDAVATTAPTNAAAVAAKPAGLAGRVAGPAAVFATAAATLGAGWAYAATAQDTPRALLHLGAATAVLALGGGAAAMILRFVRRPTDAAAASDQQRRRQLKAAMRLARRLAATARDRRWRPPAARLPVPVFVATGPAITGDGGFAAASGLLPVHGDSVEMGAGLSCHVTDSALFIEGAGAGWHGPAPGGWSACKRVLHDPRWRRAVAGVFFVLDEADLAAAAADGKIAGNWRAALEAFVGQRRGALPIHIVVTGIERLDGFDAWLAATGDSDLPLDGAIYGVALPLDLAGAPTPALTARCDVFLQWQAWRSLACLEAAIAPEQRFAGCMFPARLAQHRQALLDLAQALTDPSERGPTSRLALRSISFTTTLPAPDVCQKTATNSASSRGFLRPLLRQLALPDARAGLHHAPPRRRLTWLMAGGLIVASLVGVGVWLKAGADVAQLARHTADGVAKAGAVLATPAATPGLAQAILALDALRPAAASYTQREGRFGLYERSGMDTSRQVHAVLGSQPKAILRDVLYPRLMHALAFWISNPARSPEDIFRGVQTYRRLAAPQPSIDADGVRLIETLCAATADPAHAGAACASLPAYLAALVTAAPAPLPADPGLITSLRGRLAPQLEPAHGVALLAQQPEAAALPPWRPAALMLNLAAQALGLEHTSALAEGAPGLFTAAAFPKVVQTLIPRVAHTLASRRQVLADHPCPACVDDDARQLADQISDLYARRFIAVWQGLLDQLAVARAPDPHAMNAVVEGLLGPPSPLRMVLDAVARETRPDTDLKEVPPVTGDGKHAPQDVWRLEMARRTAAAIARHFEAVRQFSQGADSPLEHLLQATSRLRDVLASRSGGAAAGQVGNASVTATPDPALTQALEQLSLAAANAPAGLARSIRTLAAGASQRQQADIRRGLAQEWRDKVAPAWRSAIAGRYPFDRAARIEVRLDELARVLGPGGVFDTFQQRLTGAAPAGAALAIAPAARACLNRATQLRAMLFAPGATAPAADFTISMRQMASGTPALLLNVNGSIARFSDAAAAPAMASWPGAAPGVAVQFAGSFLSAATGQSWRSPWGLFRMLDAGRLRPEGDAAVVFDLKAGDRTAMLRLDAPTSSHPFAPGAFADFTCPDNLGLGSQKTVGIDRKGLANTDRLQVF